MKRYQRLLVRHYLAAALPVLGVLLGLFAFLLLAEALEDVGKGSFGTTDALLLTGLRLPAVLVDLLPVGALMGGLLGLGILANSQQLIALQAAGLSPLAIATPVFALLVVGALLIVALQFVIIPGAQRSAVTVGTRALPSAEVSNEGAFWTRSPDQILRVNQLGNGRTPRDIEIYTLSASGQLTSMLRARTAVAVGVEAWLLEDVDLTEFDGRAVVERHFPQYRWSSFVDERALSTLILPASALDPLALRSYIRDLDVAQLNSHQYRVMFWQNAGKPLGLVAMGLLAVGFVQGSMRGFAIGTRLLIGTGIGITYFLIEQSSSNLAVLFELPAALAALLPELALLALAIALLMRGR